VDSSVDSTAPLFGFAGDSSTTRGIVNAKRFFKWFAIYGTAVLLIRIFLFQVLTVGSDSFLPTWDRGERVWVNKVAYRLGDPIRGDVIVFSACDVNRFVPLTTECNWRDRRDYFKRVAGAPGDTIEIREGTLYVNGDPERIEETPEIVVDGKGRSLRVSRANLLGSEYGLALPVEPGVRCNGPLVTFGPVRVGAEEYFVLGDNRMHSFDSRFFGSVPKEYIKGRALGGAEAG
jgi:signal peptidase I